LEILKVQKVLGRFLSWNEARQNSDIESSQEDQERKEIDV